MRADQLLVARGLAATRSQAQRVLAADGVMVQTQGRWKTLSKGAELADDAVLKLVNADELKYASRGGLKLAGALAHTGWDIAGHCVLDVGQSTGGFTDCALQHGAARVIGVDVGHGQLVPALRSDPKVVCLEGINARQLSAADLGNAMPAAGFDTIVGDVSFISMTLILVKLAGLLADSGRILFLIKPQFELQPEHIAAGGIVRDVSFYALVEARIRSACAACELSVLDYFASPIAGGDGNREFFMFARKTAEKTVEKITENTI